MEKQKTKKSISRRFRITKNGKVLHRSTFARHLRSSKSKSQKRRQKQVKQLTTRVAKKIRQILGK